MSESRLRVAADATVARGGKVLMSTCRAARAAPVDAAGIVEHRLLDARGIGNRGETMSLFAATSRGDAPAHAPV